MQALAAYNTTPYDENNITFGELYEKWKERHFKDLSKNTIKGYETSYNHCKSILNLKIKDIKAIHLQNLIDSLGKNHTTLKILKNLLNLVFKYAMEMDIIQKDYSKYIKIGKHVVIKQRTIFTDHEFDLLWANLQNFKYVDNNLIMIYTGMKIGELLSLRKQDIDLVEQTITIKESKTIAGRNRIIPIHPRLKDLIQSRYEYSSIDNLVSSTTNKNYLNRLFTPIMETLNMDHTPHDCRHTFATRLNDAGGNSIVIKKMIGRESFALIEKVYTHKKMDKLRKALELVN